jgi:hypothetical protein
MPQIIKGPALKKARNYQLDPQKIFRKLTSKKIIQNYKKTKKTLANSGPNY